MAKKITLYQALKRSGLFADKKAITEAVNAKRVAIDGVVTSSLQFQFNRLVKSFYHTLTGRFAGNTVEKWHSSVHEDLTWLTPASLEQPSKSKRLRPWKAGLHAIGASEAKQVPLEANTKRRMLENFRSVLYAASSAFTHVKDPALQEQWKQSYIGFTKLADKLHEDIHP